MSIQTNALALHEILLSISDSLNKAQNELRNMPAFDEYGRPNTIYQLPYLDFNLEVISEFSAPTGSTSNLALPVPVSSNKAVTQLTQAPAINYVRFVSLKEADLSNTSKDKIVSTISGRFVAVMPNEGLPQVFISAVSKKITATGFEIRVKLQNATGDPVIGQRVEVNFDQQTSFGINGVELTKQPVFGPLKEGAPPVLKDGFTNENGEFSTYVQLDNTDYYANRTFIFVANSGTLFASVAISNI